MHLHAPLREGRGPLDALHLVDLRRNEGLVREVDAAELEAVPGRGRLEREGDLFTRVQGSSRDARRLRQGRLVLDAGSHKELFLNPR